MVFHDTGDGLADAIALLQSLAKVRHGRSYALANDPTVHIYRRKMQSTAEVHLYSDQDWHNDNELNPQEDLEDDDDDDDDDVDVDDPDN